MTTTSATIERPAAPQSRHEWAVAEVGRVYGIEAFRAALPAVVAPVRERSSRLMKVMGPAASNVVDLRQTEPNGELIGAIRRL